MKRGKFLIGYVATAIVLTLGLAISSSFAAYEKGVERNGSFGEISLRSYFEKGTGTKLDPYVITRPRHLYNLSRLQDLGVFGSGKKYFNLGLVGLNGDSSGEPRCYASDTSADVVPYLNMSNSNYDYEPITPIGTESEPFFSEFDGQNLEIKNLNVYADPEDAGLFGYTAHGSEVKNLFLDNITINSLGYTDGYENLYGEDSTAAVGVEIDYSYNAVDKTFTAGSSTTAFYDFDAEDYFGGDNTALPATLPSITATLPSTFRYMLRPSGDFVSVDDNTININIENVYSTFKTKKAGLTPGSKLTANSTVSVIAYAADNLGLEHSKVVLTLEFNFTLSDPSSTEINMEVRVGAEHGNNIGFLIGHCDGTARDCYVHEGTFNMNNNAGGSIDGDYNPLVNSSSFGLIGAIGGTVYNRSGMESGSATNAGKDIGVIDFTTIYKNIVDSSSFLGEAAAIDGITFTPREGTEYEEFLRRSGSPESYNYYTKNKDYVSFCGQKVISNDELGVFTIATDEQTAGTYGDCAVNLDNSVIHDEGVDINYLYYATGEYNKAYVEEKLGGHATSQAIGSTAFRKYALAMEANNPDEFLLGHHLPSPTEISVDSFEERESHQNYFFRFQITASYREDVNDYLYFADVDDSTPGGSFLSKYFEYKLVDQDYRAIPAGDEKCGVMLRDPDSREIPSFRASFQTPDLSYATNADSLAIKKIMCLDDSLDNLAANMVNFEITTDVANVTVVAAPSVANTSSALGVYKYDSNKVRHYESDDSRRYWNQRYDDPDYAFFMPKDSKLSYFDYKTYDAGDTHTGQIGFYESSDPSSFVEAGIHDDNIDATSETRPIAGIPRLFVHTFKLEQGRYALGAATGSDRDSMSAPKIYYVCAQGQEEGQLEFKTNVFTSDDIVEDIDFIKVPRYTNSEGVITENILVDQAPSAYSSSSKALEHQRCYVLFAKDPIRSSFADSASDINIVYDTSDSTLKATTSTPTAVTRLAFTNYGTTITYGEPPVSMGVPNTYISYQSGDRKNDDKVIYPE